MDAAFQELCDDSHHANANYNRPQVAEHIYFGNNVQTGNPGSRIRQETFTFDGGPATYYGQHTGAVGNQVTLPSDPIQANQNYAGLLFHVASGAGVGQVRRIVAWQGHTQHHQRRSTSTWTLDSPLATQLDNTSYVSIGAYCGHIMFESNTYVNGTQFQLFGVSVHVILSGNSFLNMTYGMHERFSCWTIPGCGGVLLWGFSGGNYPCHHDSKGHFPCAPTSWTIEPNYYISVLNNSLVCSKQLTSIGPDMNGLPPGTVGPRSFGHVHRGNTLAGNTDLIVNSATWSALVEGNTLINSCSTTCGVAPPKTEPAGKVIVNLSSTRFVWVRGSGHSVPPTPNPSPPLSPVPIHGCNASTPTAGLAAADAEAIEAVQELIARRLGAAYVKCFVLGVISPDSATGNDVFELNGDQMTLADGGDALSSSSLNHPNRWATPGGITLRGSSGVALATGLGFYLKALNCSWAWGRGLAGWTMNALPAPGTLPQPPSTLRHNVSTTRYRYAYNVVTFGYTTWAWSWADWEEELDKLALWGVNLPLAAVGQEALWLELYTSVGLSSSAVINDFFSGPAFLPWNRMGNIQRSWGAPLSLSWIAAQEQLQLKILRRMRSFGMMPVLPGFAGHVPSALATVFPNASIVRSPSWRGFKSSYSEDSFLEPSDALFKVILIPSM